MTHTEHIEYQDNLKKYNRQSYGLVWWTFLLAILTIFTVVFLLIVIPVGIICSIGCFFYLIFVVKKWRQCLQTWEKVKNYRVKYEIIGDIKGDTTYCFVAPFATSEVLYKISQALLTIGEIKNVDSLHGIIKGSIRFSSKKHRPITFYVEKNNSECKVRACFHHRGNDVLWDSFLTALFTQSPGINFSVSASNGHPVVVGVLDLQGNTEQVFLSTTKGGISLGGFLIGGALFGGVGAVVGGLSGKRRTVTNSRTIYSNDILVRIIYSNGRLWEGTVRKGSPFYNEILVSMK